jgi:hypothetical protein
MNKIIIMTMFALLCSGLATAFGISSINTDMPSDMSVVTYMLHNDKIALVALNATSYYFMTLNLDGTMDVSPKSLTSAPSGRNAVIIRNIADNGYVVATGKDSSYSKVMDIGDDGEFIVSPIDVTSTYTAWLSIIYDWNNSGYVLAGKHSSWMAPGYAFKLNTSLATMSSYEMADNSYGGRVDSLSSNLNDSYGYFAWKITYTDVWVGSWYNNSFYEVQTKSMPRFQGNGGKAHYYFLNDLFYIIYPWSSNNGAYIAAYNLTTAFSASYATPLYSYDMGIPRYSEVGGLGVMNNMIVGLYWDYATDKTIVTSLNNDLTLNSSLNISGYVLPYRSLSETAAPAIGGPAVLNLMSYGDVTLWFSSSDKKLYSANFTIECYSDAECGTCMYCNAGTCEYQDSGDDVKDECSEGTGGWLCPGTINTPTDICTELSQGDNCNGAGACEQAMRGAPEGRLCQNQTPGSGPGGCDVWAMCGVGQTNAPRYLVGCSGNIDGACSFLDAQILSDANFTVNTGYQISVTENASWWVLNNFTGDWPICQESLITVKQSSIPPTRAAAIAATAGATGAGRAASTGGFGAPQIIGLGIIGGIVAYNYGLFGKGARRSLRRVRSRGRKFRPGRLS